MKRKLLFIVISLICSFTLVGCTNFTKSNIYDDHERCDKLMEKLTLSLSNDEFDNAKSMFSKILYDNGSFDEDLNLLIEYFDGEIESINGRVTTGDYSNYDYNEKHHALVYTVITSIDTYRFRLNYIEKDSRSKMNIGIRSLYVLKLSEDEYPDELYTGDISSVDGIHVAFPHIVIV